MTHRVGAKGQVVIPIAIRQRLGLRPGADVEIEARGDEIVVHARRPAPELQGRFGRSGMARRLLEDRAAEPR